MNIWNICFSEPLSKNTQNWRASTLIGPRNWPSAKKCQPKDAPKTATKTLTLALLAIGLTACDRGLTEAQQAERSEARYQKAMTSYKAGNLESAVRELEDVLRSAPGNLSARFLLCVFGMFLFLGVYALGWQQVLKRLPLTVAYATSKAVVFLWMLLFGALLFHERVSPRQLLGCALLMAGVVLFALSEKEDEHES